MGIFDDDTFNTVFLRTNVNKMVSTHLFLLASSGSVAQDQLKQNAKCKKTFFFLQAFISVIQATAQATWHALSSSSKIST